MSHTPRNKKGLTKIGQLRDSLGMTQSELAKSVDVTEATIKIWEKKQPNWIEPIIILADELHCETLADLAPSGAVTQLRDQAGLTRRELADRIGVKENTLAKWESEGVKHLEKLLRLCLALKCASRPEILVDFFNHKRNTPTPPAGAKLWSMFRTKAIEESTAPQSSGTPENI